MGTTWKKNCGFSPHTQTHKRISVCVALLDRLFVKWDVCSRGIISSHRSTCFDNESALLCGSVKKYRVFLFHLTILVRFHAGKLISWYSASIVNAARKEHRSGAHDRAIAFLVARAQYYYCLAGKSFLWWFGVLRLVVVVMFERFATTSFWGRTHRTSAWSTHANSIWL